MPQAQTDRSLPLPDQQQFESPNNKKNQGLFTPTKEEQEDLRMVTELMERGKNARKEFDQDWGKQENFYDGKQWLSKKRAQYKASPVANVCRPIVETIIPILTDTAPGFDVLPAEPTDFDFAETLSMGVQEWWKNSGMNHTLVEALYDQSIFDAGIMKVPWNPEKREGLGDIDPYIVDPRNIYVPKGAVDFDKKCPWVIEVIPNKTIGELKRKFPDKADFITPTGNPQGEDFDNIENHDVSEIVLVSPVDRKSTLRQLTDVTGRVDDSNTVTIAEAWLDDYSVEDFMLENENGEPTGEMGKRRKYPYGKIVTWIPDNKVLLQSKPSPYKDGKKPYIRFVDTIRPRKFWGQGAVEPVMESQENLNKVYATIMDWCNRMVNPVWIIDSDAGVTPQQITNQVGLIIVKKPNTTVTRNEGTSLPAQIFNFYQTLRELIDTQSGVHDVTQGRKPTGVTAAQAIDTLQEAAQTRLRLKERNMMVSLTQLGKMVVSRMMQFYTVPRMTKITGQDGWPKFVEWYVKETKDELGFVMVKKVFKRQPDGTMLPVTPDFQETAVSKGEFDVKVQSGTSLPFAKAQRGNIMLQLFDRQAVDQQALLDAFDIPNKEEIVNRMQQAAQEQAQIAAPMPGGV